MGLFVIVFVSTLASAGGLGGGGMQTPFLMIFFKLTIYECVPIANLFGLLATGTRFLLNYRQRHPNPEQAKKGRLSIDYEIVMITMPMMYLGTMFGVQIGSILNEIVLLVSLMLLTGYAFYKTFEKALEMRKHELTEGSNELLINNRIST